MSHETAHVVIVGAGHAGGSLAAQLRQNGHAGRITLVGEEPIPPYQRPPLSKAWLKGEADAESLALKPLEFYADNAIEFRPNVRALGLERWRRQVALSSGEARGIPDDHRAETSDRQPAAAVAATACRMSWVAASGWDTNETCEAGTSTIVAFARSAMNRCSAGGIALSSVPSKYQHGSAFQAGGDDGVAANAATA